MLRLRRAELEAQVAADTARLAEVEARLRMIETEGVMSIDVVVKSVPAVRLAELSGIAESYESEQDRPGDPAAVRGAVQADRRGRARLHRPGGSPTTSRSPRACGCTPGSR